MKKNIKKQFMIVMILAVFVSVISCGKENKKNETIKKDVVEVEKTESSNTNEPVYLSYDTEGIDEEFTTDGKLHEDKFLNKMFSYTDTADSFKIEKNDKGYFITAYVDESFILEKEVPIKEEKSKLKLYKDVYLVDENGLGYAYDTRLEKLVFINSKSRIINIADEID